jgi:hypothetical protein
MTHRPPHLFLFTSRRDGLTHWKEPGTATLAAPLYLCGQPRGLNDELLSLVAVGDAPLTPDTCPDCARWADELWPVTR